MKCLLKCLQLVSKNEETYRRLPPTTVTIFGAKFDNRHCPETRFHIRVDDFPAIVKKNKQILQSFSRP